jgi:four helix bundle protein
LGSCNELEYDLLLARDLAFVPHDSHSRLAREVEEVRRMLIGLVRTVTK